MAKQLPSPAKKLAKPLYESFAAEMAKGRTLAESYGAAKGVHVTPENEPSLKVSGWRISKRPEVVARVEYLQEIEAGKRLAETEAMVIPESFDSRDILELFFETTEVLESVYQAMIDQNLPEVRRREYFTVLSSHLARQGSLVADQPNDALDASTAAPLHKMAWCQCQ